jgi:uncharacterized membrane protein YidH (DUF202 family)
MPTGDTERTRLASERTQLAWWRTGLAAMAVSLGVGRVVPAIDDSSVQWPYTIVGVAFALYGIALGTATCAALAFARPWMRAGSRSHPPRSRC